MPLPEDLKNYAAPLGIFQLIPPHTAGYVLLALVGVVCILGV